MKTAQDIYQDLINIGLTTPTQLCSLHKPCATTRGCQTHQHYPVLDFDRLKHLWRKSKKQSNTSSVDALTHKSQELCFVEIKGWKQFLIYQKVNDASIQQQVNTYDLQGKLLDSVALCEEITGETDILKNIPSVYLLVTDINIKEQGLESITTNLNLLGSTSTNWETVCNKYLGRKLGTIKQIKTQYITCAEFDNLFNTKEKYPK